MSLRGLTKNLFDDTTSVIQPTSPPTVQLLNSLDILVIFLGLLLRRRENELWKEYRELVLFPVKKLCKNDSLLPSQFSI